MRGIGIITNKQAVGEIKEGAALVAEAIKRIIITSPYERPRSAVGCDIRKVLFEPNDVTAATLAAAYINQAIQEYEPRAEVVQIIAVNNGDNTTTLRILFRLVGGTDNIYSTSLTIENGVL